MDNPWAKSSNVINAADMLLSGTGCTCQSTRQLKDMQMWDTAVNKFVPCASLFRAPEVLGELAGCNMGVPRNLAPDLNDMHEAGCWLLALPWALGTLMELLEKMFG